MENENLFLPEGGGALVNSTETSFCLVVVSLSELEEVAIKNIIATKTRNTIMIIAPILVIVLGLRSFCFFSV